MYEFLRFYIHCTSNVLFCISAHVCEAANTNVLLVLYNSSNTVFDSVNESVFERVQLASDSTVHSDGLTCFVSIESAVLNKSFDMNDSVSHLLKQGLAATYWRFYCHIYGFTGGFIVIFIHDRPKPAKVPAKNTFIKILFNYQYCYRYIVVVWTLLFFNTENDF